MESKSFDFSTSFYFVNFKTSMKILILMMLTSIYLQSEWAYNSKAIPMWISLMNRDSITGEG